MKYDRHQDNLHIKLTTEEIQGYRNWIMDKFANARMNYLVYDVESALKEASELVKNCAYPYDYEEYTIDKYPGYREYHIEKFDPIIYENTTITLREIEKLISTIMNRKKELESLSMPADVKVTESEIGQQVTRIGQAATCSHCKGSGRCSCNTCREKMAVIEGKKSYQEDTRVCFCLVCNGKGLNWIGPDKVDQSKKIDIKDNIPGDQRIACEQMVLKRIDAEERLIQKQLEKLNELQKTEQVVTKIREDGAKRVAKEFDSIHKQRMQQKAELSEKKIALLKKELSSELERIREEHQVRTSCENEIYELSLMRARNVREMEIDPKQEILEREIVKLDKSIELEKIKASKSKKGMFGGK